MDLLLDNDSDLSVVDGEIALVAENEAIRQHLQIRLKTFLGEWFLDTTIGMPYFEEFLIKSPSKLIMEARMREAILETPGIASINSLLFLFESSTRSMTITFEAALADNTTFQFNFTELIIGN